MPWFFVFFTISGFCGILYELVWMRLAMAQFTVTTPFLSMVMSVFMLGMGIGSWLGGRWIDQRAFTGRAALRCYAGIELLIGISAILVPLELACGRTVIAGLANSASWAYYPAAGVWIAFALLPWCAAMGATYPFAMSAIRGIYPGQSERSFSFLYMANVAGAVLGSLVPLALVEMLGFRGASRAGMALSFVLAAAALAFSARAPKRAADADVEPPAEPKPAARPSAGLWMLFGTGLTTMGVEVVWVRLYSAYLGTVVYAVAGILAVYLASTYVGSRFYRSGTNSSRNFQSGYLVLLGLSSLLVLIACDPRRRFPDLVRLFLGVAPFSAATGFLTPLLMDRHSGGDPQRAGRGYAVNIAGCVAGPLLAAFVLLPLAGERYSMFLFAVPWLAAGALGSGARRFSWARLSVGFAAALGLALFTRTWENAYPRRIVLRDHTSTVVATGTTLRDKQLIVNGMGMTNLTPITKMMAHLPLAFSSDPSNALVICFGMGTTHRSVLTWGIHSTAVELTPSVPRLFPYFHADGRQVERSPLSRIVIDDGRSYLERTPDTFDVVIIDPPPPVEAAASSLLYSREFYAAVKARLRAGGILQQWLPPAEPAVQASVTKALAESFPYLRVLGSVENNGGFHFLASSSPIPKRSAAVLASRLPAHAAADMLEWGPAASPEEQFALMLTREIEPADLIARSPAVPTLRDDRPVNEYYLLRNLNHWASARGFAAGERRPR